MQGVTHTHTHTHADTHKTTPCFYGVWICVCDSVYCGHVCVCVCVSVCVCVFVGVWFAIPDSGPPLRSLSRR